MIILDTSGLLAALDSSQHHHTAAARALSNASGALLLSPFVFAELDYLIATKVSHEAALLLMEDVGRSAYRIEAFDAADVSRMHQVINDYADLRVGLADASLVVLSERYQVHDVLTLDERHFRILRGAGGHPFRLLPADS